MIKIDLDVPVIMEHQLPEIASATNIDEKTLKNTLYYQASIALAELGSPEGKEQFGPEAIIWLCKNKGYDLKYITTVEIPDQLYIEVNAEQWLDISHFCFRISDRNKKLKEILHIGIPDVIVNNQKKFVVKIVNLLERNKLQKGLTRNDGMPYTSLYDVGYSLINGWSEKKKAEFRKKEQDIEESITRMAMHDNMIRPVSQDELKMFTNGEI